MIDIENYKAAVAWLRRNIDEVEKHPEDPSLKFALLQSFEVTYNLSEAMLRHVYVSLGEDKEAPWISTRELIWRAYEDGIVLSSRKQWAQYGLALESMRETCSLSGDSSIADAGELLRRFADELESFAGCLEQRLARNG